MYDRSFAGRRAEKERVGAYFEERSDYGEDYDREDGDDDAIGELVAYFIGERGVRTMSRH